jgi:glycosyltransferase involved in cell wall biosynthesis
MKLFLIKLGKAFSVIRRDGIIVGGRRVWNYLVLFTKNLLERKAGDVLIITGGVGDSAHYRAYGQAEEFNLHEIRTSVIIQDNPFLSKYADKFKVFIFHRTIETPAISKLISKIKRLKKEIIFETDDLVFDTKYIHQTDLYKNRMSYFEKKQYEKGVGEEILKDSYVKACSTTTTYLAKILESYGKKVFISKNKFINHELEIAEKILKNVPKEKDGFIKLGYYSGTASHDRDFETIIDVLLEIFKKFSNVKLIIAGPLNLNEKLNDYKDRIIRFPLVPRDEYYENLYKADINLAPLVLGDPFCESKSEIKFSGAGIFEIPTVAVKNQTFSEAISDGIDGFIAETKEEWIEKLEKLIVDENLRKKMGRKAREKVLMNYTNKNSHNEEYYNYLKSCIMKHEA